jgi:signal transduction histidine kinase
MGQTKVVVKGGKKRRSKGASTKPRSAPKASGRSSSGANLESKVARLASELGQKLAVVSAERDELLQQQAASIEILGVINSSHGDLAPVFDAILEKAMRLCEAAFGSLYTFEGEHFQTAAQRGLPVAWADYRAKNPPSGRGEGPFIRLLETKRPVHIPDIKAEKVYRNGTAAAHALVDLGGGRTVLYVPLLKDHAVLGTIVTYRQEVRPFTDKQIALLKSFADQAVIAIENARLFNETQQALERQTATAEILKVIAASPSDVQPVFEAIAERSTRLVSGFSTAVHRLIDGQQHLKAFTRISPEADAVIQAAFPRPLTDLVGAEQIRNGEIFEITDTELEFAQQPPLLEMARKRGYRSMVIVPLLRDREPIGLINVTRRDTGRFAAHHVNLLRTFADQAVIAIENARLFNEVQERTRELSRSLDDLRTAQDRLIQTEKLASLGQLTAGIAHEIKNPLNFVNNFSALSAELIDELDETLAPAPLDPKMRGDVGELTQMLKSNLEKVVQHGKRADSIVKNMLLHSREGSGERRSASINGLVEESLNLAYHGARAEKTGFNITIKHDLDPDAGAVDLYPQEITRALLNLISNGFYAAIKRKAEAGDEAFEPVLSAATRNLGKTVEIRIRDNGTGIPPEVRDKMFNPFFTTKPTGEGTGLGLSMSHDIIVKQHGGSIDVETEPGLFTEFKIVLPRRNQR